MTIGAALAALAIGCGGEGPEAGGGRTTSGPPGASSQGEGGRDGSARGSDGAGGQGRSREGSGEPGRKGGSEKPERRERPGGAGDSESPDRERGTGEGTRSGKARFLERANAICARSKAKIATALAAYMRQNAGEPMAKRIAEALRRVYGPAMRVRLAALRELAPPRGDAAQVAAIWKGTEAWVERATREGSLAKAERRASRIAARARAYGLGECSSD